jgi:tetratricopeptide (TPR) repeat protein
MGYRFPQPDNEDDFEKTCLRFYRKLWKNESLTLYGKRGEGQDGIDIFDPANLKPVRVIQCKHHEPTKSLEPAAIKDEVAKAEKSVLRFETYQIATTAKKTRRAQDAVDKLNRRSKRNKRFTVEIHFWEDICELLSGMPRIQSEEIIAGRDGALDFLASILVDPNVRGLAVRALKVAGQEPSAEDFAEIEHLLGERKLEVAQHELDQLTKPDRFRSLAASEQYKLLRLQGKLALERGSFESASRLFLDAFELQPDLDQAKQNRALAYELLSDSERAFDLAVSYTAAGLTTPFLLCRLIENAKALSDLHEYAALFDAHLDTSVDINVSLSRAFLNEGDFKKAIESATRALQIDPCSPYAAFAAGMCHHFASTTGVWLERMPQIKQHPFCKSGFSEVGHLASMVR